MLLTHGHFLSIQALPSGLVSVSTPWTTQEHPQLTATAVAALGMALKGPRPLPSPPPSGQPDPFLAQSLDIPLTARDRQEGYDVDLLDARPRGVSATSTNGAAASVTAVEAAGGSGGAGATEAEKYAARNKEEDNALSSSRAALAGDEDRPRRRDRKSVV